MYRIQSDNAKDLSLEVYDDEVRISFMVGAHEHSYVFPRSDAPAKQQGDNKEAIDFPKAQYYVSTAKADADHTWLVGPNKHGDLVVRKHRQGEGWSGSLMAPEDFHNEHYNFRPITKDQFLARTEGDIDA